MNKYQFFKIFTVILFTQCGDKNLSNEAHFSNNEKKESKDISKSEKTTEKISESLEQKSTEMPKHLLSGFRKSSIGDKIKVTNSSKNPISTQVQNPVSLREANVALMLAIETADHERLKQALVNGADVHQKYIVTVSSPLKLPPLEFALSKRDYQSLQILLDWDAKPVSTTIKDIRRCSLLIRTLEYFDLVALSMFLKKIPFLSIEKRHQLVSHLENLHPSLEKNDLLLVHKILQKKISISLSQNKLKSKDLQKSVEKFEKLRKTMLLDYALKQENYALLESLKLEGIYIYSEPLLFTYKKILDDSHTAARLLTWFQENFRFDFNHRYKEGQTLLHVTRNPNSIEFLISKRADIYARDSRGRTPLATAVESDSPKAIKPSRHVQVFLSQYSKIHINSQDNQGKNILHLYAEQNFHLRLLSYVKELVEAGVDPFLPDASGRTAAEILVSQHPGEFSEYFKEKRKFSKK